MEEKNRFSRLLEQLMLTAGIKNYTLAQELQYDVSYISKWVNGRIIPAEKSGKKVLAGISHCITYSASDENQETLMQDYQVDNLSDLETAIYDNLEAEYDYVKDLQKNLGTNIAPKTFYFAELALSQYISKMHHPVLRRVKSLDIMAAIDLMSMEHEYRLQFGQIEDNRPSVPKMYPDVHLSMLIDLESAALDYVYDPICLISILTNLAHVDFRLYSHTHARGKAIFAVKDDFAISGMLVSSNHCISVAVSEEAETCNVLYNSVSEMCNREMLLFRRITMGDMLCGHDYARTLLAPNPRWLMGHMTEHFMPDDLFEQLVGHLPDSALIQELRKTHTLTCNIIKKSHIQLMIYESAFFDLAVSDELDFYDHRIHLSAAQRLRYLTHMLSVLEKHENLEIRLVHGRFIPDFQYISNQCVFLSDTISYLRLDNNTQSSLLVVNQASMQNIFNHFYDEIWNYRENTVISDRFTIFSYIRHVVQTLQMIRSAEEEV